MELTIDRLFRTTQDVAMPTGEIVQVRALSDPERKSKSLLSLKDSIKLEDAMATEESDEWTVYVFPLMKADKETLLDIIEAWTQQEASRESFKEVPDEHIEIPEGEVSDDEKKEILRKRVISESETQKKREAYIKGRTEAARKKADTQEMEALRREAVNRRRALESLRAAWEEDAYASVFYGTEKNGKRYFSSIEEVKGLDGTVLRELLNAQRDVDSIDPYAVQQFRDGRTSSGMVVGNQESEPAI
jgi:hypothetical protein